MLLNNLGINIMNLFIIIIVLSLLMEEYDSVVNNLNFNEQLINPSFNCELA